MRRPDRALPRLPLDGPEADAFEALTALILASSAFPFAFSPVEVPHCPGAHGERTCRPEDARTDLFLDGGIFDQNPLTFGLDAVTGQSHASSTSAVSNLYLLDPFQRMYPQTTEAPADDRIADALSYGSKVAGGFIETARSQGLEMLLRRDPALENRLVVSASEYPPYGEMAFYFLSFFEEDFRRFDFILGMIESQRARVRAQRDALQQRDLPVVAALAEVRRRDPSGGWVAFQCVKTILGPQPQEKGDAPACAAEPNMRALAMVSRERVYESCRPERLPNLEPDQADLVRQHPDCRRAFEGHSPPAAGPNWRRRPDERQLQWVFRRLETHGYRFQNLGATTRADVAYEALRDRIARCASVFASAQSRFPALPEALARAVVNQMAYRPPQRIYHVALGPTAEVGFSQAIGPFPEAWLRATTALEFSGLATLLSARENFFGVGATVGLEAEILPWSGPAIQTRTALRGGWLFATPDNGGFGQCDAPGLPGRPCSRPIFEAVFSLHVIDFVRFAVTGVVSPAIRDGDRTLFEVRPSLGAQLVID